MSPTEPTHPPLPASLIERRDVLFQELRQLLVDRAQRQTQIEQDLDKHLKLAEKQLNETRIAQANALGQATSQSDAQRDEQLSAIEQQYTKGVSEAKAKRQRESGIVAERAEVTLGKSKKEAEEGVWFAETCRETDTTKSKAAFEASKENLSQRAVELDQLLMRANFWCKRHRLKPIGAPQPPAFIAPPDDPRASELAKSDTLPALLDARDQTLINVEKLESKSLAWVVRGPAPMIIVLLLAIGAGVGTAAARQWKLDEIIAYAAGGGALLGALIVAGVYWSVRSHAKSAGEPIRASLAAGKAAHARTVAEAETRRAVEKLDIHERFVRESNEAKRKYAATVEDVRRVRDVHLSKIQAEHDHTLAELASARQKSIDRVTNEHTGATAEARATHERDRQTSEAKHAQYTQALSARAESSWQALSADWSAGMERTIPGLSAIDREVSASAQFEQSILEPEHAWPTQTPPGVRLGAWSVDLASLPGGLPNDQRLMRPSTSHLNIPAMLELPGRGSLLVRTPSAQRQAALSVLRTAMLRLLASFPPGKVRFTLIDPVGLGESFAGFMHLAEFDDTAGGSLVGDRIWTEPKHIEQKLSDLTQHMEDVIQKYLRNEYADIEAYNKQAGEVAEPYRFVVFADLPAGLTENAAKKLASILASGPRCGVYALMACDPAQRLPMGLASTDLERGSVKLTWNDGRFVADDAQMAGLSLSLDAPELLRDEAGFTRAMSVIGGAARNAAKVQVPFSAVEPPSDQRWSLDSAKELRIPLGKSGATKLQHLVLGRGTAQHALIAGRTGSGKSTLLNVLITNIALWYSPDQVELCLIDFKKGVEFKAYANANLPHARVIAIESEREFGLSVLKKLDAELKRRGDLFRAAGVQDLAAYRASPNAMVMPRTLLIVDEFQEFFVEDDKLAQECGLLLDRLVRQGRAFGMHVVLGSQTLAGAFSLARSTMGQMGVRIALQCSEADSYLIMSDDNSAPRLLTRPGEAIYNDASGLVEGNSPFQIVWLDDSQREQRLHDVARMASDRPKAPPVVFEGSIPARLETCAPLLAALDKPASATPPAIRAWLGDAVSIKDPTAFVFRRQSASNLLIVGQRDEVAASMLASSLLSLGAQLPRSSSAAKVYLLDGTPTDSPLAGYLPAIAKLLPQGVINVAYRDVPGAMDELGLELASRQLDGKTDAPPVFVVINGLQRFRNLRKSEDDFGFSSDSGAATSADKHLVSLVREGPPAGMHVIAWCDTAVNLERATPRNLLREFDGRVLLQMNSGDSSNLIDSPAAANLGQSRALFYSEEQGVLEKFRPYAQVSLDVATALGSAATSRA